MDELEITPNSPVLISFAGKGLALSHTIGGLARDIATSMTSEERTVFLKCFLEEDDKLEPDEPEDKSEDEGDSKPEPDDGQGDAKPEPGPESGCANCGKPSPYDLCDDCMEMMRDVLPGADGGDVDYGTEVNVPGKPDESFDSSVDDAIRAEMDAAEAAAGIAGSGDISGDGVEDDGITGEEALQKIMGDPTIKEHSEDEILKALKVLGISFG